MQNLEIFDFEGRQDASSAEQLHRALCRRCDGGNHFEIAAFGRPYPMLDLMVSGDLAVVHYFAAEDNAGAQSITAAPRGSPSTCSGRPLLPGSSF